MTKRAPRRDTSIGTMVDDHTRKVFEITNGRRTVYVFGRTPDDARHTCYVHDYLHSGDDEEWDIVQDHDGQGYAEANRRFEALHGR